MIAWSISGARKMCVYFMYLYMLYTHSSKRRATIVIHIPTLLRIATIASVFNYLSNQSRSNLFYIELNRNETVHVKLMKKQKKNYCHRNVFDKIAIISVAQ